MAAPSNGDRRLAKLFFTEEQRIKTYRKLASLIKHGTNVDDAVAYLYKRASKNGKKPTASQAIVFSDWLRHIRNGAPLHVALQDWAPANECMIIAAGEKGGGLAKNLIALCVVVESSRRMRKAVVGSVFAPIMLMFVAIAVMMIFGIKVIPMFAKISKPDTWTGAAYMMYVVSSFINSIWFWLMLGSAFAAVVAIIVTMPKFTGPLRVTLDRIPPWSIYRLWVGSGFIKALEAMVASGLPVQKAITELRRNATPYLRERLNACIVGLKAGHNLGVALERSGHNFPDKEIIEDFVLYAEQSEFDAALEIIGKEWLENGVKVVETQAAILNLAAKATMGLIVGWIVSGTFSLQATISDSMQNMSQGPH